MHFFVKATSAPTQRSNNVHYAAIYLAVFFVVTAFAQLFSFEDFPGHIKSFGFPIDSLFAPFIAALVVTFEVFSIPFYLRMRISPLMRLVSIASGWIILVWWLVVGIWQSMVDFKIPNSGLFGSDISIPSGWWMVSFLCALLILNTYVLWGTRLSGHLRRK
ncbi:MAG: MauE/DoxX family redox-associated membrane protein [Candidatus Saccharibacteria bacterium]